MMSAACSRHHLAIADWLKTSLQWASQTAAFRLRRQTFCNFQLQKVWRKPEVDPPWCNSPMWCQPTPHRRVTLWGVYFRLLPTFVATECCNKSWRKPEVDPPWCNSPMWCQPTPHRRVSVEAWSRPPLGVIFATKGCKNVGGSLK